uniref:Uncharacterized protein n=1 Tax=Nonomuraea gerenzanensis TaxID=93944 RepID=A0A1M4EDM0_9ACTN|nr:hypothetical protein BN4615_P6583 [Nonomuraea gerenzanensis]
MKITRPTATTRPVALTALTAAPPPSRPAPGPRRSRSSGRRR